VSTKAFCLNLCVICLMHRSSEHLAGRSGGTLHASLEHVEVEHRKSEKSSRILRRGSQNSGTFFRFRLFHLQVLRSGMPGDTHTQPLAGKKSRHLAYVDVEYREF
jgi:hypothetical protein